MAQDKTQFLHFNAYSIKEMIVRKLTEDTNFTDQIYEGSNLNILIDLVAYMYQCLMYNLNNAAAESMFADTRLYENMRRLVKFIGYNPKGIIPSVGIFYFDNTDEEHENSQSGKYADKFIQKYSYIDTGVMDEDGNQICYSTIRDIHIDSTGNNAFYRFQMYNGRWVLHHEVFVATGDDYESFVLDGVGSNLESDQLTMHVANGCIDVYVEHEELNPNGTINRTINQFKTVDFELFAHNKYDISNNVAFARIYTRNDQIVNVQLNEFKQYEIKFGNGIVGQKLRKGDKIYVFYLQTNGKQSQIDIEQYGQPKLLMHDNSTFGLTQEMYESIFKTHADALPSGEVQIYLDDITTEHIAEEEADDIRKAAPEWFKLGQRLVTVEDYQFFIKNMHKGEVLDCNVMNNFQYASIFYKWLYALGKQKHQDGSYYINQKKLTTHNLAFIDPADSNNLYVWIKLANGASIDVFKDEYAYEMQSIKTLTTNIVFLDAIDMNFSVTAMPTDVLAQMLNNEMYSDNYDSYIEVTMESDTVYASNTVAQQINKIIVEYFRSDKVQLGKTVNCNEICQQLYLIDGIKKIRTVYVPKKAGSTTEYDYANATIVDGLSFATWSAKLVDLGDDLQVSTGNRTLQEFQYPVLYDTNIAEKVKIVKQTINAGTYMQI